jgi:hypothetical protein
MSKYEIANMVLILVIAILMNVLGPITLLQSILIGALSGISFIFGCLHTKQQIEKIFEDKD